MNHTKVNRASVFAVSSTEPPYFTPLTTRMDTEDSLGKQKGDKPSNLKCIEIEKTLQNFHKSMEFLQKSLVKNDVVILESSLF